MSDKIFNVLFLRTGNSAHSVMAEVLLNKLGRRHFAAHSAGSHPTGYVHPLARDLLNRGRMLTGSPRSKSWDEFATMDAPRLDLVFTVYDKAAGEVCPVWPGQPMTAHWGIEDRVAVEGSMEDKRKAFLNAYTQSHRRSSLFLSLPIDKRDRLTQQHRLDAIGRAPRA
ncbi:MAG TPA: arsenate reductase ArsC [Thiobacillaceae bacterium]|nr:arsenate reductase ArsC [Thiobacillaceae bacterium]